MIHYSPSARLVNSLLHYKTRLRIAARGANQRAGGEALFAALDRGHPGEQNHSRAPRVREMVACDGFSGYLIRVIRGTLQ